MSPFRDEAPDQDRAKQRAGAPSEPPEVGARISAALALAPSIVEEMTRRLVLRAVRQDDLISYANEGALTAGRSYDPTYGVSFNRWAALKIRAAIVDGLRSESVLSRRMHNRLRAIGAAILVSEGALGNEAKSAAGAEAADAGITD